MSKYLCYDKRLLQTTNDPVLTIVRLTLGVVFFAHGAQKALGWFGGYGFAGTLEGFSKMGYLFPWRSLSFSLNFSALSRSSPGFLSESRVARSYR
jgi:uncharacterized membrane protein YphA (DoxX/SURF4 family)